MEHMKKRLSNKEDTMRTSFPKKNGGEVIFAELLAKFFPEWKTSVHRAGHTQKKLSRRDKKNPHLHTL